MAIQARSECVISNVLEVFGDKWTLLVIRDLFFFDKHEYKEFLASPEAIATNVLSDRLKRLVATGIVGDIPHPENRSRKLYYLTAKGKALFPILEEMAKWGATYFPELPAMQDLYERIGTDSNGYRAEIFESIDAWERAHLSS